MRINREELLKVLESVSPGLATRENIEQSCCLVFHEGDVITFNDEVACTRKSPLKIEGAVNALPFLTLLSKMTEDFIDVEQNGAELRIKGKGRKAGIRMEKEVRLPIESIEKPEKWKPLHSEFSEALRIVHTCASSDESEFILTCVHIHPEYLEACDRFQIARYQIETGVEESVLVRAESLKKILGFDMTEVCETESWMHFRNPVGLVFSCRRWVEIYNSLDAFMLTDGLSPVTLPGGLEEVVEKAEIFSNENVEGNYVTVSLQPDRIIVQGEGASGWYKELKKVKYSGEPIVFLISPNLLVEITKKSNECGIAEGRLFIDTGKFQYATCTQAPEKDDKKK